jgi:hypothetical protein
VIAKVPGNCPELGAPGSRPGQFVGSWVTLAGSRGTNGYVPPKSAVQPQYAADERVAGLEPPPRMTYPTVGRIIRLLAEFGMVRLIVLCRASIFSCSNASGGDVDPNRGVDSDDGSSCSRTAER